MNDAAYEACEHGVEDVDRAVEVERQLTLIMSHHKSEAEAVRKRTIWESYAGMHHLYSS